MKYIAAYALLILGGKSEPSQADVEKFLKDAGVKAEGENTTRIVNALKGKQFHELVASGKGKMSSAATVVVASAAGTSAPAAKKEEEKPKEEEADVDMGGLFGGDDY